MFICFCAMKNNILLIIGFAVLLAGAIMSMMNIQPYADYVLVAGAVLVIFRGAIRSRERLDEDKK